MRHTPKAAIRDFLDAAKLACTLLKDLPLRSLVGVILVSVTLGAVPMLLTLLYSVMRTLADCYRDALHRRAQRSSEIPNQALPISAELVTTNHFTRSLETVETL